MVNVLLDFGGILVDDAVDFSASDQTILQASEIMPFPRKKKRKELEFSDRGIGNHLICLLQQLLLIK